MKKLSYLFFVLILVSCGNEKSANISSNPSKEAGGVKVTAQSIISQIEKGKYKEGELLVKFKPGVVTTSSLKIHQAVGTYVIRTFTIVPNLEQVKLPEGVSVKNAIIKYTSDPNVDYAEPNYIKRASAIIPNDTYFRDQWALLNTGKYANGTPGADIKATDAWNIFTGSSSIIMTVLDTGIDYNHIDLVGNIWTNPGETNCANGVDDDKNGFKDDCKGWNFTTCARFDVNGMCVTPKSADNDPMDNNGHGTHVAGIIGAVGNNGIGISGVMWNVKLMAVKFLNADGGGTTSDEIAAIDYVVLMKNRGANIKVINASFAGSFFSISEQEALKAANSVGILVMAAAGNGGDDGIGDNNDLTPEYPASYSLPNIISVATTDQNDRRASFSNFGLNSVHVAAPGVYILSTGLQNSYSDKEFSIGTSMSTPHVSGLAGLLWSYYDYYNYSQIRGTILRYVDVLPTLNGWIQTGGRINAYRALSSLLPPTGFSLAPSTNQVVLNWTDNARGEDEYLIERKTGGGSYALVTTLESDTQSFTDSGLTDGTAYTYRLKAYNYLPNLPSSSPIQAQSLPAEALTTTPLNPPTGLTATALSSSQVSLIWTDNSQSEEGYKIERKGTVGNFAQVAVIGPNTTNFTDSGLSPSTRYWYRVRAFNSAAGDSLYSNDPSITTLSATGESTSGGGGGGGCSIGARQNTSTAITDLSVMLIPLLIIAIMRRRR